FQSNIFEFEELLILAHNRVLRFGENLNQRVSAQFLENRDYRHTADKLRDEAEFDQIHRLDLFQHIHVAPVAARAPCRFTRRFLRTAKPDRFRADPAPDNLFKTDERPATDEQDIRSVHGGELLVRMLSSALRRYIRDRAFEDLQQRLLHSFARYIAGNRWVLVLAADFVDFVDVNDPLLAALHVPIGILQEPEDDVLHILANVPGLGQRGRIHDREWHVENPGQRLRQ